MTTTSTNSAVNNASAALLNAVNPQTKPRTDVEKEQDKFMTLLLTQLQNQDPLNPMDNAAVTSQMAQLSTVTGVNKLNETLQKMQADQAQSTGMNAVNLIGHGVLVPGNELVLDQGAALLGVETPDGADAIQVQIYNSSGKVVQTIQMQGKEGVTPLTWNGKTADDKTAPDGTYSIKVTAVKGGQEVVARPLQFGVVASAAINPTGTTLNVSGMEMTMNDIKQVLASVTGGSSGDSGGGSGGGTGGGSDSDK